MDNLLMERIMEGGPLFAVFSCDNEKELLDVTIDEIGRPYEDLQGFENRLWRARENALIDGYKGLRMNLDLDEDTTCKSGDLNDVLVFDVKYTMKIIHLCDQVVVRKRGSTAFVMLKDRFGGIH